MSFPVLLVLALGLAVDAFAAAIAKGAAARQHRLRDALKVGATFGACEALTPAIGWLLGTALSRYIASYDHWVAFILLAAVGLHLIKESLSPADEAEEEAPRNHFSPLKLFLTGMATSIDATAVGVSLAVIKVNLFYACVVIGVVSFGMSTIGVMIGKKAGALLGRKAEAVGGVALIAIGAGILIEHLSA
ncbi:manganese efflux pump MntP family protein [Dongia soli]|uniref:Putative manganese efflux pump MntP n=1 Tax=Dongia soli TaxID=600628 RepID=A0ABU5EED1_9PROT|nr:manganese efflux pump MntP family protein [Dongia soli]MDY0883818.1 manganese efflux pump MntP family protein [Dongia soli]